LDVKLDLLEEKAAETNHWMRDEALPARVQRQREEAELEAKRRQTLDKARRRIDERYGESQ
jgi:hypothetical protein